MLKKAVIFDMTIVERCLICNVNLTLMESCRNDGETGQKLFLVKRCLNCGDHPVEEVIELLQQK